MKVKVKAWHKSLKEFVPPHRFLVIDADGALHNDDVDICQFTGLTDKNGVEIYEGDIVKSIGVSDYCFGVRPVIFDNGCFKVSGYGLFGGLVEVVGNIHQNPELLK